MKELFYLLKKWAKNNVNVYNFSAFVLVLLGIILFVPDIVVQFRGKTNPLDRLWFVAYDFAIFIVVVLALRLIAKTLHKFEKWLEK